MKRYIPAAAALLLAAVFFAAWKTGLIHQLSDYDKLVESLRQGGWRGPLLCVGAQFLQVVIFMIPGEITQLAAGYVFGAWRGFAYSVAGIMMGSAVAYLFGRVAGRPALERILGGKALEKIDSVAESPRAPVALFLLFLVPGAPKDAMSYGAGLTKIPLGRFVLISSLGRTPALLASTVIGAQFYDRDYRAMALTAVAAVIVVALFWIYQKKLVMP